MFKTSGVFHLVVSFLVVRPHIKGALHQQLPEVAQVSLKTSDLEARRSDQVAETLKTDPFLHLDSCLL